MKSNDTDKTLRGLHAHHPRDWRQNRYVYPVISRRAGGLSVGINLNLDKRCNFDCVYCQVDRDVRSSATDIDLDRLREELRATVGEAVRGDLFASPPFSRVPAADRRIRDIAFSGDGEPTACAEFPAAVDVAAGVRREFDLRDARIVLITNSACLHLAEVRRALEVMDANNGEIWAKLDAGTEEYYRRVNRSHVPFDRILTNILDASLVRPIVIQSLWMSLKGAPPPEAEIAAFAGRLKHIIDAGGRIRLVQVYTVARKTAEPFVSPLTNDALGLAAQQIRAIVDLRVETYTA